MRRPESHQPHQPTGPLTSEDSSRLRMKLFEWSTSVSHPWIKSVPARLTPLPMQQYVHLYSAQTGSLSASALSWLQQSSPPTGGGAHIALMPLRELALNMGGDHSGSQYQRSLDDRRLFRSIHTLSLTTNKSVASRNLPWHKSIFATASQGGINKWTENERKMIAGVRPPLAKKNIVRHSNAAYYASQLYI